MRTLLVLIWISLGVATETTPTPPPAESTIAEKRAAVGAQLRVAQQTLRETNEDEATSTSAEAQRVAILKQLDLLYAQQETALARTQALETARATADQALRALQEKGPEEKKPYSFFLQENLHDSLTAQKARVKAMAVTVEEAAETLARAKQALELKEKERRQAKENLSENTDAVAATDLSANHELAKLESRLAEAEAILRETELANVKLEHATAEVELQFLTEKFAKVQAEVTFSAKDLKRQQQELDKQESDIARKNKENDAEVALLRNEWEKARQRADNGASEMQVEVKARAKVYSLRDARTEYFTTQSTWIQKLREIWKWRFNVATDQFQTGDLAAWRAEVESFASKLAADKSLKQSRRTELRAELEEVERLLAEDNTPEVKRWLTHQADAIRAQLEFVSDHIARGEATSRTAKRLAAEIKQRTNEFSPAEWASVAWEKMVTVWEYELTKTQDDKSLRVKSVAFGLLLLALGYRFSRKVSRILGTRVLPKLGINSGGASALQTLMFYGLLCTTTLMALRAVSVPLTMFTFLGGAAAIGVGFGSQNIVNNFISGLILLTEQPIRVGDHIDVNGLSGKVEAIGMRSTRLRSGNMQEIIVPNSAFLENNVVNWTRTNATVGCSIAVGVAHGSPTRDVARWLKRAADEHGLVLNKPEPAVTLAAFGESTLDFQLSYHIAVRSLGDRGRIESDLRFIVDQYFREAGISLAFAQRDVHIDTLRPLEVRMISEIAAAQADGLSEAA